ncbi:hypothetical protein LYSHEL_25830 [Lysobacter helvus]|uniref:Uncharacterized protein n=2 Tax=Lysobacteraceae TaxID=32033 RepID=A0ABM7Q847_9GAMM|nr:MULTISPECIES: hypothetical protein [Lysobacter]BCT93559.1 hypothetical protein LYSCAS_25830 [Lysobacter caseinilyticus]BCT96712.1 hypothetical protein LYSHEL_25830 [Lysobacter helvus]
MERQGIARRAGVVLLVALLAATGAMAAEDKAQDAKDVPFLGGMLRESHIVYPLKVGDWGFVGEHRYDDQAAGVSVRFARQGDNAGWIDVYFYPVGVVSDDDLPKFAEMERRTLEDTWLSKTGTGDIKPLATSVVKRKVNKDTNVPITTFATDFEYTYEGQHRNSAMVVAVDRLYAIKFRYSALADHASRNEVRRDIEAFAHTLLPTLDIGSSGACWDPPPIEVLAADAPDPEDGVLATTKVDDVVTTFAMRDRVLTRRSQDDPSATLMQMMVMSMTGRLYDGCTGKDSQLPEVPEGMREVRFEYRAPDAAPLQAEPMRARRAGVG